MTRMTKCQHVKRSLKYIEFVSAIGSIVIAVVALALTEFVIEPNEVLFFPNDPMTSLPYRYASSSIPFSLVWGMGMVVPLAVIVLELCCLRYPSLPLFARIATAVRVIFNYAQAVVWTSVSLRSIETCSLCH